MTAREGNRNQTAGITPRRRAGSLHRSAATTAWARPALKPFQSLPKHSNHPCSASILRERSQLRDLLLQSMPLADAGIPSLVLGGAPAIPKVRAQLAPSLETLSRRNCYLGSQIGARLPATGARHTVRMLRRSTHGFPAIKTNPSAVAHIVEASEQSQAVIDHSSREKLARPL
jgi:hypothetical protein